MQFTDPSESPETLCSAGEPDNTKVIPVSSWMILAIESVVFDNRSWSVSPLQLNSAVAAMASLSGPIVVSSVNTVALATGTAHPTHSAIKYRVIRILQLAPLLAMGRIKQVAFREHNYLSLRFILLPPTIVKTSSVKHFDMHKRRFTMPF